jgi:uncharacterized membrane protein YeiH
VRDLPDLATQSPLWLALVTVAVNALVGALHGIQDDTRNWDIVGVTVFALLMGLGGGFVRDLLLGNLPAESLRTPWYLVTVLGMVPVALLVGQRLARLRLVMTALDALALGLFAVTGTAHTLTRGLPLTSAVLVGTVSAVGGGMLVSIMRDEVPAVLMVSAPNALLAVLASTVYAVTVRWSAPVASLVAIAALMVTQFVALRFGLRTRPTVRRQRQHRGNRPDLDTA